MGARRKILHIITRLDRGGSAQNTLLTCQELSRKYDVVLAHGLSLESKMNDWERQSVERQIAEARKHGLRDITIPSLVRRVDPVRDIRAFLALLTLLRREKPAIVHTHTYKAGILGSWAAKMAGVPIIIHTPHGHIFFGHFSPQVTRCFMLMERLTAAIVDRMVALTEGERSDYVAFSVANQEKMVTIHSGVNVDRFMKVKRNGREKKLSLGLNAEAPVVGTVGWLLPIKGPIYLLKAMAEVWHTHPDIQLVYVGKGDLEEEVKGEAYRTGLSDKVKFLGWRDDIPEIMQFLDIFVLPSLNEGMGRVLVEAMACGKPIVASNVGGIPDLVKDGHNGFLVGPGDVNGLSLAIKKLIEDEQLRLEMGAKGRAISRNYGVEEMIKKIDDLYTSLYHEKVAAE
jgi:glycosyltransferase involved in cell wall biosynthesis